MTTDSDSECSYVANLADFNVMRVSNHSNSNNCNSNNSNYSNSNNCNSNNII